jgi:hypothetical protein
MWFSYNNRAACCSDIDSDRRQCDAMASSSDLRMAFDALLDQNQAFAEQARRFYDLWPIFKAQEVRSLGVERVGSSRGELVDRYRTARPNINRQPECLETHLERRERVPLDWPHTLFATYQVRCNLFHGEKAAHSEMAREIVDSALRTMIPFLEQYLSGGRTRRPPGVART